MKRKNLNNISLAQLWILNENVPVGQVEKVWKGEMVAIFEVSVYIVNVDYYAVESLTL